MQSDVIQWTISWARAALVPDISRLQRSNHSFLVAPGMTMHEHLAALGLAY
jgi:hypothetical protein